MLRRANGDGGASATVPARSSQPAHPYPGACKRYIFPRLAWRRPSRNTLVCRNVQDPWWTGLALVVCSRVCLYGRVLCSWPQLDGRLQLLSVAIHVFSSHMSSDRTSHQSSQLPFTSSTIRQQSRLLLVRELAPRSLFHTGTTFPRATPSRSSQLFSPRAAISPSSPPPPPPSSPPPPQSIASNTFEVSRHCRSLRHISLPPPVHSRSAISQYSNTASASRKPVTIAPLRGPLSFCCSKHVCQQHNRQQEQHS